jgi:hypothetical protein
MGILVSIAELESRLTITGDIWPATGFSKASLRDEALRIEA